MVKEVEKIGTDRRTLTTCKEKSRRFDFINGEFMSKYLDLVWFARANPAKLLEDEIYEALNSLKKMEAKYPEETKELLEDDTNWTHGFNSGVLAYARFLSSYLEDGLWEVGDINKDIAEHEKVITINGVKYIEFDGRTDAQESFPELYT